jgi:hypothetical protein
MNSFTDKILSTFDQLSTRVGVLNSLVDAVVSRIAPESSANAHCPYWCAVYSCEQDINCMNIPGSGGQYPYRLKRNCANSYYECTHGGATHDHNECVTSC